MISFWMVQLAQFGFWTNYFTYGNSAIGSCLYCCWRLKNKKTRSTESGTRGMKIRPIKTYKMEEFSSGWFTSYQFNSNWTSLVRINITWAGYSGKSKLRPSHQPFPKEVPFVDFSGLNFRILGWTRVLWYSYLYHKEKQSDRVRVEGMEK